MIEAFLLVHWVIAVKCWALLSFILLFAMLQYTKRATKIEDIPKSTWGIMLILSSLPPIIILFGLVVLVASISEMLGRFRKKLNLKHVLFKERSWGPDET